eukprot:56648-Eustigmatos_ZCMA.PRE.1
MASHQECPAPFFLSTSLAGCPHTWMTPVTAHSGRHSSSDKGEVMSARCLLSSHRRSLPCPCSTHTPRRPCGSSLFRYGKLDWKVIAHVQLEQIIADVDVKQLQH